MRFHFLVAAVATALSVAACTTAPIYNVEQSPVVVLGNKQLSQEQVRAAIVRAGVALGWQIRDEGPNTLVGTLQLRRHLAVITIPYSATNYSIKYRSSENLEEGAGVIHKNYNGWIQNLNKGIVAQLNLS